MFAMTNDDLTIVFGSIYGSLNAPRHPLKSAGLSVEISTMELLCMLHVEAMDDLMPGSK